MNKVEILSRDTVKRFDAVGPQLAAILGRELPGLRQPVKDWRRKVRAGGAMLALVTGDEGEPVLATFTQSSTPQELFRSRYSDTPEMESWLARNLPARFVRVDMVVADRQRSPSGNLAKWGAVLSAISDSYGGVEDRCGVWQGADVVIAASDPRITRATVRDVPGAITLGDLEPSLTMSGRQPLLLLSAAAMQEAQ